MRDRFAFDSIRFDSIRTIRFLLLVCFNTLSKFYFYPIEYLWFGTETETETGRETKQTNFICLSLSFSLEEREIIFSIYFVSLSLFKDH